MLVCLNGGGAIASVAVPRFLGGWIDEPFVGSAMTGAVICRSNTFLSASVADGNDSSEGMRYLKGIRDGSRRVFGRCFRRGEGCFNLSPMQVKKMRWTAVGPVRGGRGAFVIVALGRHENDGAILVRVIEKIAQKGFEAIRGLAVLSFVTFRESLLFLISNMGFKTISGESPQAEICGEWLYHHGLKIQR